MITRLCLLLVCIGLAACAAGPGAGSSARVVADEHDEGKTVTMDDGDRLVLRLPPGSWRLLRYPGDLLRVASPGRNDATFRFAAENPGTGVVRVASLSRFAATKWRQCGPVAGPAGNRSARASDSANDACPSPTPGAAFFTLRVRVR